MLIHLQIRDFAIVESLELAFEAGMTALTGETGAGKSIMIDALGLLLGDRADSAVVRHGAERAEISAVFDLSYLPTARAWLAERELDAEDCHLRRLINVKGRSRGYVNGSLQPLQSLKELGQLLVDIHGQHEHQSLLRRDQQRQLLDDHAANQALLTQLAERYEIWKQLKQQLDALYEDSAERDARLDLLRYHIQELDALDLQPDELASLEEEHRRLANAGRLLETCQSALTSLYENEDLSAHSMLGQNSQALASLCTLDARLNPIHQLLNSAAIQVREAGDGLRHYLQELELDPQRLAWMEQRLADIFELARKHRIAAERLPALRLSLQAELEALDNSDSNKARLEKQLDKALQAYLRCAEEVSARRAAAAEDLSMRVSAAMQDLGMRGGRFKVALERHGQPSPTGLETVEFQVSANPGQPLRPLNKVASGGELSRISLAIQVIAACGAPIPILVFDEVDSGIGGGIAEVVGRRLRTLSETRQVLCVTHLPQVAVQAHHHLLISKRADKRTTQTTVTTLGREKRVQEIARMLGGLELTDSTLAHAREMIQYAQG